MQEKNDFAKLNADDRRLIAIATGKSKNLVDKVLRGVRNNKLIIHKAIQTLEQKEQMIEIIMQDSELK